jgi:hypothetical protein
MEPEITYELRSALKTAPNRWEKIAVYDYHEEAKRAYHRMSEKYADNIYKLLEVTKQTYVEYQTILG